MLKTGALKEFWLRWARKIGILKKFLPKTGGEDAEYLARLPYTQINLDKSKSIYKDLNTNWCTKRILAQVGAKNWHAQIFSTKNRRG